MFSQNDEKASKLNFSMVFDQVTKDFFSVSSNAVTRLECERNRDEKWLIFFLQLLKFIV